MGLFLSARARGFRVSGAELTLQGNVPWGAGISSSAAYTVAVTLAAKELFGWPLAARVELASMAREGEANPFVGARVGLLDQMASLLGEKDTAFLINYGDLSDIRRVKVDLQDYALVLANSKVDRSLAQTDYNTRVEELSQVPDILNRLLKEVRNVQSSKTHVSAFTLKELDAVAEAFESRFPVLYRRARHVLTERERTLDLFRALQRGNIEQVGRLLDESGDSLSMSGNFEISGTVKGIGNALDMLVGIGRSRGKAFGRMMGGGGGGSALFLVKKNALRSWREKVSREYEEMTGLQPEFYPALPSSGARIVWRKVPQSGPETVRDGGRFAIETVSRQGFELYRLVDRQAQVCAEVLPERGFSVVSLNVRGREILYQPEDLTEDGGSRSCGRLPTGIKDGQYVWRGRKHDLRRVPGVTPDDFTGQPIHGLVRYEPWNVRSLGAGPDQAFLTASFRAQDRPAMAEHFGDTTLTVVYRLQDGRLTMEFTVFNHDRRAVIGSLAVHPWFRIPADRKSRGRVLLQVPAGKFWQMDRRLIPLRQPPVPAEGRFDFRRPRPLGAEEYDHVFTGLAKGRDGRVRSTVESPGDFRIALEASGEFQHWVVYAPDGWGAGKRGVICVEPQTSATDSINLYNAGIRQATPILLESNQTFKGEISISADLLQK